MAHISNADKPTTKYEYAENHPLWTVFYQTLRLLLIIPSFFCSLFMEYSCGNLQLLRASPIAATRWQTHS